MSTGKDRIDTRALARASYDAGLALAKRIYEVLAVEMTAARPEVTGVDIEWLTIDPRIGEFTTEQDLNSIARSGIQVDLEDILTEVLDEVRDIEPSIENLMDLHWPSAPAFFHS